MDDFSSEKRASAVELANLFRDCVECFGSIHQGKKDWDRPQRLLLAKLGIQQARLLAWGHIMGICDLGEGRDPRLDDKETRKKIIEILKTIIDRPSHMNRVAHLETYGLKPSKRVHTVEQALDHARLEAFREQYHALGVARSSSVTAHHWIIADNAKFKVFIGQTRSCVDMLIEMTELGDRVSTFVKYDIRALGWHPVFDRVKAANDGSKLRLIKDSCKDDYPEYSEATDVPLAYLNTQWTESYEAAMARAKANIEAQRSMSDTPASLVKETKSNIKTKSSEISKKHRKPSIFRLFSRPNSKKRHSIIGVSNGETLGNDTGEPKEPEDELSTTRSKSETPASTTPAPDPDSATEMQPEPISFQNPFGEDLSKHDTATSSQGALAEPVASMISRHDQIRASV